MLLIWLVNLSSCSREFCPDHPFFLGSERSSLVATHDPERVKEAINSQRLFLRSEY